MTCEERMEAIFAATDVYAKFKGNKEEFAKHVEEIADERKFTGRTRSFFLKCCLETYEETELKRIRNING